jgi:hypothetical protein
MYGRRDDDRRVGNRDGTVRGGIDKVHVCAPSAHLSGEYFGDLARLPFSRAIEDQDSSHAELGSKSGAGLWTCPGASAGGDDSEDFPAVAEFFPQAPELEMPRWDWMNPEFTCTTVPGGST